MRTSTTPIYHEQQELYRCGIHALNNALQARVFDKATLDAACEHLAVLGGASDKSLLSRVWNPHRSSLGIGNYDVNVLMFVLQAKGYTLQWLDKRQRVAAALATFDTLDAVVCNVVTTAALFRTVWATRHWFALKSIDGVWYNLDSKLPAPVAFETPTTCFRFLQELIETGECELFALTTTSAAANERDDAQESASRMDNSGAC